MSEDSPQNIATPVYQAPLEPYRGFADIKLKLFGFITIVLLNGSAGEDQWTEGDIHCTAIPAERRI